MSSLSFALVHFKGPILCLCPSTWVSTRIGVNTFISKKKTHYISHAVYLCSTSTPPPEKASLL